MIALPAQLTAKARRSHRETITQLAEQGDGSLAHLLSALLKESERADAALQIAREANAKADALKLQMDGMEERFAWLVAANEGLRRLVANAPAPADAPF